MRQPINGQRARHVCSLKEALASATPPVLIEAELVTEIAGELGLDYRERIFTPFVTLWAFLSQVLAEDSSLRAAVSAVFQQRLAKGLSRISTLTGSLAKARARLPERFLERLVERTGHRLDGHQHARWRWRGSSVKVVDATVVSMPDTVDNAAAFPKLRQQKMGVGFPTARVLGVFSLTSGALVRLAVGAVKGKGTSELSLLTTLWDVFDRGDTLLGDALFSGYATLASALTRGIYVVTELPRARAGRLGRGKINRIVVIRKPRYPPSWLDAEAYQLLPETLTVRLVRVSVTCAGFRPKVKYVLTTRIDGNVTADELADLYRRRWNVELYFRSIKADLGMDVLKGRCPAMVRREIFVHLLGYNVVRTLMLAAAADADVAVATISFRASLVQLASFRHLAPLAVDATLLFSAIVVEVGRHRVGGRPNRYEPRAIKRQRGKYRTMIVPRPAARARLWKRAK